MRIVSIGLALLTATACTSEPVSFEHAGSVEASTRGVELYADGNFAQAGMGEMTCELQVSTGNITMDVDSGDGVDDVQDADGDSVIVVTDDGIAIVDPGMWEIPTVEGTDGASEGRFTDDGFVFLREGGDKSTVEWSDGTSVDVPDDPMAGGNTTFDVDPSTGTVFLGTADGFSKVTVTGIEGLSGEGGDLSSWDPVAEVLYAATEGDDTVRGIEADGTERFATQVPGTINALSNMGAVGAVAVMVELSDGSGQLVVVDGYSGEITSGLETPSAADDVTVSADGTRIGFVLPNEVHFFDIKL